MKRARLVFAVGTVVVVACVIVLAMMLPRPRNSSPETTPNQAIPIVTTVAPKSQDGRVKILGNGTVRPLQEVTLVAEVGGKITWVAEEFVTGGAFRQGQEMLRIDSTDYANAVVVARAEAVQRQFDLLRAEEEMAISKQEWRLLESRTGVHRPVDSTELGSLVFKEPHWKVAVAQLQSARARLRDAEMRLSRTRVVAPYNGRLRTKGAGLGQFVGPGHMIGSYYGTDAVEISVSVSGRDLTLLGDLLGRESPSTRARLIARYAGAEHEWMGVVHRTEGALSELTRTLNVIVRVQRPYERSNVRPPLLVGTFVTAYLEGRHFDQYYMLPREALKEAGEVWVVRGGRLYGQPVEVIQEVEDTVYVLSGVTERDSVVTNMLNVVTDGMRVRAGVEK